MQQPVMQLGHRVKNKEPLLKNHQFRIRILLWPVDSVYQRSSLLYGLSSGDILLLFSDFMFTISREVVGCTFSCICLVT